MLFHILEGVGSQWGGTACMMLQVLQRYRAGSVWDGSSSIAAHACFHHCRPCNGMQPQINGIKASRALRHACLAVHAAISHFSPGVPLNVRSIQVHGKCKQARLSGAQMAFAGSVSIVSALEAAAAAAASPVWDSGAADYLLGIPVLDGLARLRAMLLTPEDSPCLQGERTSAVCFCRLQ